MKLIRSLFRLARLLATIKAISKGKAGMRLQNIIVGRKLGKRLYRRK